MEARDARTRAPAAFLGAHAGVALRSIQDERAAPRDAGKRATRAGVRRDGVKMQSGSRSRVDCAERVSRRRFIDALVVVPAAILAGGGGAIGRPAYAATKDANKELLECLTNVVQSQRSLKKASVYLDKANWDKARTYVVYCTRKLRLRSSMKKGAELMADQSKFVDAMECAAELDNILTQLDASIYTAIFIPPGLDDDGFEILAPEALRYQAEGRAYYAEAMSFLDTYVSLFPAELVSSARERARTRQEVIDMTELTA
ncbi:hypothetical protein FVE85_5364 [Porphyridium purpureum]|uniref:Uncharacterized protein n=1 Tax=Porphyridium purpureum TaxID=35688 RepID=A0A5J4Z1J9_PORPP|nr:hypothetical protein FVE85_5364 [Porphyridium purpureum]|eukprot:POR0236..scf295_1